MSVVPGGVYGPQEALEAVRRDGVVAAHYRDISAADLKAVVLGKSILRYVSFRLNDRIYWTRRKIPVRAGEVTLAGITGAIRARCGNRLSETPQQPTLPVTAHEPTADELDRTDPDETNGRPGLLSIPAAPASVVKSSDRLVSQATEQPAPGTTSEAGSRASGIYGGKASGVPGILAPIGGSIFPPGAVSGSVSDGLMMPPPDSAGLILIVTVPQSLSLTFAPGRTGTGATGTGATGVAAPIILKPGAPTTAPPIAIADGLAMPAPSGGNPGPFPMPPTSGGGTPSYIPTENFLVEGGIPVVLHPPADSQPTGPGTITPEPSSLLFFGTGLAMLGAYSGKLRDGRRKIIILLRAAAKRLH